MGRRAVSPQEWDVAMSFKRIENENKFFHQNDGRNWDHIYERGYDSKYGSMLVCWEEELRRSPTMDEFYGGASWD